MLQFLEFKQYAIHVTLKDNPKLERSISLFNGLSQWVQCMVLSRTTPQQRANIIVKFVNVAKVGICNTLRGLLAVLVVTSYSNASYCN